MLAGPLGSEALMKMSGWAQGAVSGGLLIPAWVLIKHQGSQLEKPLEEAVGTWQTARLACFSGGCWCFLGLASETVRGRWHYRDIPV